MSDNKPGMSPEQILNFTVSNGRLAGLPDPSADTLEIVRKIAYGEMSDDEIADWKMQQVREIRKDAVKDRLRLKYLPVDFDHDRIDEYERYLSMSDDEQKSFLTDLTTDEVEFWIDLETSRALYQDPLEKRDGSITEAKVAAHPNRYGWKP
ncbi:hypothetical protein [Agrobacterium tumefaciens]|uniref:hypothetical protein n=1 Tax=Agrobacterium tumefaciens TaxID=358 RepID=UPI0004598B61|nr:hypothetical protein [Agrobacterium tumefaciens]CDN95985.1 hypothetical protein BN949_05158 [Agrobacterium tumefaciens]